MSLYASSRAERFAWRVAVFAGFVAVIISTSVGDYGMAGLDALATIGCAWMCGLTIAPASRRRQNRW